LGLRKDTVKLPSGKKATREIVEHPGAVAIVAITDDNELVLVRQFRTPTKQVLLEIPAGVPLKKESAIAASRRELEEETGFRAKKVRKIFEGYATPGYSDEVIQFCLAQDLVLAKPKPDEDEFLEVDLVDIDTCVDLLKTGKIHDIKTMLGIMIADMVVRGEL